MNKIFVRELKNYFGKEIVFQGFVDNIRDLQYVQFVILRDHTGLVQMTIEKNEENKTFNELIATLTLESTLKVSAMVTESPKVKLNGMELIPTKIEVTSVSMQELPIDIHDKEKSLRETRLDYRFLDLRREENQLLFQCETLIEQSMREFWIQNDFIEIHTPKISAKAAESGSEVFKLDYFGQPACLSQSPQFYKQMSLASGFDRVFEIGPAFRAENSHTSYHATEINMADTEIAWIDSVDEVMEFEEVWIKYFMNRLRETYGEQIKKTFQVELSRTDITFPRISFMDAKKLLQEKYHYVASKVDDLERKEEELLCQYAKETYDCDFIFVTRFPASIRPFYHMRDEDGFTCSYDLLFAGVEITTGAQREHRYDVLKQQIIEKKIDPKELDFYLQFFQYGCPPHGGFGVGIARIMMQIFHIDNIREATLIYRGPTRLNP